MNPKTKPMRLVSVPTVDDVCDVIWWNRLQIRDFFLWCEHPNQYGSVTWHRIAIKWYMVAEIRFISFWLETKENIATHASAVHSLNGDYQWEYMAWMNDHMLESVCLCASHHCWMSFSSFHSFISFCQLNWNEWKFSWDSIKRFKEKSNVGKMSFCCGLIQICFIALPVLPFISF